MLRASQPGSLSDRWAQRTIARARSVMTGACSTLKIVMVNDAFSTEYITRRTSRSKTLRTRSKEACWRRRWAHGIVPTNDARRNSATGVAAPIMICGSMPSRRVASASAANIAADVAMAGAPNSPFASWPLAEVGEWTAAYMSYTANVRRMATAMAVPYLNC
eukprot:scaffold194976_cov26-Tisochrysis_lutea.AAC.3